MPEGTRQRFEMTRARFGRRAAIRGGVLGAAGLGAAALIGCGDDEEDAPSSSQQPAPAGTGAAASGQTSAAAEVMARENAQAKDEGAPFDYHFAEPAGQPKSGGTLVLSNSFPAGGPYDPTKSQSGTTILPVVLATNRLIGIKTGPEMSKYKTELTPELANSWEVAPDGLTYTFRLQQGVKWHNLPPMNGRALVAKDIANTYERHAQTISRSYLADVESFTAPDDRTLVLRMKGRNADQLIALATHFLTIFPAELLDQGLIAKQIVGTGPMVFEREDQSSQFFKANPDYWRGRPYLDAIEIRHIVDPAARMAAFRAGQTHNGPSVATRKVDADLLLKSNPDTRIYSSPVLVTASTHGFNLTNPKFADERVRRALSLALDRPKYITLASGGNGADVHSQAFNYVFDKRPTGDVMGKYWKLDLAESKKQLAAAGAGNLEFTLLVGNNAPTTNAETLSAMYKDAGVNMKISVIDYNEYLAQVTGKKYAESATSNAIGIHPAANYFYNLQIHSKAPQQYWYMNDTQIDAWAEQQKAELNPQARKDILRKIWDQLLDKVYKVDLPAAYTYQVWQPSVRYARFHGAMFMPLDTVSWIGELPSKTWIDK